MTSARVSQSSQTSTELPHSSTRAGGWCFDNSYARLPEPFYSRANPTPVAKPRIVQFNRPLAESLGLDPRDFEHPDTAAFFTGNRLLPGADPIAQAYAGHQFGHLTRLGDGRAILLGEHLTPSGTRFDIQLKGSGPTIYSRRGDGRAALGPMLREYLISEAMHSLGIPTTRSLAVASTGEPVFREQPLPGAVLTRVASSHIRVGTFALFSAQEDTDALRVLADYTLRRHFPNALAAANPNLALLEATMELQAELVAQWMRVGFVHGVMNTDNMALSGETIDYGPCAFIDNYDPAAVFSSIDHQGRYAFGKQPGIAGWNLARLAEALIPILHSNPDTALELAQGALDSHPERFHRQWLTMMRGKLGLFTAEPDDRLLAEDLLAWMHSTRADYTGTFRVLARGTGTAPSPALEPSVAPWFHRWSERRRRQPQSWSEVVQRMNLCNPAIIPRNHAVEAALVAATADQNSTLFERLLSALARPYSEDGPSTEWLAPPPPGTPICPTFCGT